MAQPWTNCNRIFFNGIRLIKPSPITYQKSRKIQVWEHGQNKHKRCIGYRHSKHEKSAKQWLSPNLEDDSGETNGRPLCVDSLFYCPVESSLSSHQIRWTVAIQSVFWKITKIYISRVIFHKNFDQNTSMSERVIRPTSKNITTNK